MKNIILILALSLFCFSSLQAQTQMQMNEQAKREYDRADKELNKVYQEVLKKYYKNTKFITNLKLAQRLWVEFKIAETSVKFPETEDPYYSYGSVFPMCYYGFLTEITSARTATLRQWLDGIGHVDSCSGSVGDLTGHFEEK